MDISTDAPHKCKTKDCKKICPVCNEEYDVRCVTLHKRKKSHIKALNKEESDQKESDHQESESESVEGAVSEQE